ncbi:MAG: radical SAM protein [Candidatus Hodarchaeota archaeon]
MKTFEAITLDKLKEIQPASLKDMGNKIGLYDVDSRIPNLALMKLSAWHKEQGDIVEFYSPLFHHTYDKIYASKIFTFTTNGYLRKSMICGGSGFNLISELPYDIEHIYPDYELYDCKYAIGFITRGCIRNCPFCIVPKKEGMIKKNADLDEFCRNQEYVKLLDNNFLAYKNHIKELQILKESGKRIDFNQGLDIRLITKENAKLIREIKRWKSLEYRFSFDNLNLERIIRKKTTILRSVGINRAMFFMLIGFDSTVKEDIKRVEILKELGHIIYPMPYDKSDRYQQVFRRWTKSFSYLSYSFKDFCKKYGYVDILKKLN